MPSTQRESRYRTIVVDPPWQHASGRPRTKSTAGSWRPADLGRRQGVSYETLSVKEIAALPVGAMAEADAHLYLWTTNGFLRDSFAVAEAWGFKPSTVLTWCKAPMGIGLGGAYTVTTEFVIFARRGTLAALRRWDTTWFAFKRGAVHSAKPDGFLDVVEQVSPGPYLEMFARRARFGWDYWGDESLSTVELPDVA